MIDILAVERRTQQSLEHQTNDSLLFHSVCDGLEREGYRSKIISEDELPSIALSDFPRSVVSMAQDPSNTACLAPLAARGHVIINSFQSVLHTYRSMLALRLTLTDLPSPTTRVLTSISELVSEDAVAKLFERLESDLGLPFWLKRGDIHAAHVEDVLKISSIEEMSHAVSSAVNRGVQSMIAQRHVEGQVIKLYGVREDSFFHAQDFESKEKVTFDTTSLRVASDELAEFLGLEIYGADVVLNQNGEMEFIDVNAWPSFGTVREEAVDSIVDRIVYLFRETN